jgi:hypothetical protein
VKYGIEGFGGKHLAHVGRIANVYLMKLGSPGHGVAMPGREVVDDRHFVTLPKQFLGTHRPYITGATCNQDSTHSNSAELQLQAVGFIAN